MKSRVTVLMVCVSLFLIAGCNGCTIPDTNYVDKTSLKKNYDTLNDKVKHIKLVYLDLTCSIKPEGIELITTQYTKILSDLKKGDLLRVILVSENYHRPKEIFSTIIRTPLTSEQDQHYEDYLDSVKYVDLAKKTAPLIDSLCTDPNYFHANNSCIWGTINTSVDKFAALIRENGTGDQEIKRSLYIISDMIEICEVSFAGKCDMRNLDSKKAQQIVTALEESNQDIKSLDNIDVHIILVDSDREKTVQANLKKIVWQKVFERMQISKGDFDVIWAGN